MLRLTLLLLIVGCGDGWKRVDEIDNGIVKDNSMENPPVLVWKRRISGSSRQNDTPRWGCDIESVFFRLNDAKTMREIVASPLLIRNDQNNETYVVVLSVVGRLLMLNARHGTEVWSVDIKVRRATCSIYDSSCRSSKFVARSMTATPEFDSDRGHIIVSDISGVVVAVSVLDGSIVWTWHVDELEEIRGVVAPALLGNIIINRNVILVPLTNSSLFELDASTGLNKRSWQISDRILASPSSYHGADGVTYYYVASWDGSLIAIDSKSEEQIWHVKIGDGIESSPLVVSSKIVFGELRDVKYRETEKEPFEMWNFVSVIYIKSTSGTLFCVAHIVKENDKSHHMGIKVYSSDGLSFEMPTFDTGFNIFLTSLIRSSPVFDRKNHAVLVLSSNGMIRSVDAKINSTRWSRRLALDKVSTFTASPNIYFDNLLIVGSWSGNLYGISSRDGSLLWIKQMCGGISSPVVSTRLDSNVLRSFAVTHYGEILAFDLVRSSEHNTKNRPRRRQRKQQQERQRQFPTPTALTNQIQSWIQSKMFVSNEECPVTDPSTRYVVFENPIHDWGLASFVRILMRLVLDIVLKQHQHDQKTFLILDNVRSVYVSRINCEERRPSILCLLRPLGPCKLTHAQEAKNHFGDHVVEFIKLNVKNSSSVDDFDSRRICRAFDSSLFLNRASVRHFFSLHILSLYIYILDTHTHTRIHTNKNRCPKTAAESHSY